MSSRSSLRVTGRVQGVGFRYTVTREAQRRGLVGWVRNERDGTVSIEVQGTDVDAFVEWIREGPRGIAVSEVLSQSIPSVDETTFVVR